MPRGPRGEKRPAGVIGAAVMVGRLATGEITEILEEPPGKVRPEKAGAKARGTTLAGTAHVCCKQSSGSKVGVVKWM